MLQTDFIELSTEVTLKLRIIVDNISEESSTPNPTLTTVVYFNDDNSDKKEYGIMAESGMSDLLSIDDISQALSIPLDAKSWDMRVISMDM